MFKYELGIDVFTRAKERTGLGDTQCLTYPGCRYFWYKNIMVQHVACLEESGLIYFAECDKGKLTSSLDDAYIPGDLVLNSLTEQQKHENGGLPGNKHKCEFA